MPYEFARLTGLATDYIERPGTGASSLPEGAGLRRDFNRYGFIALRDALVDAQAGESAFVAAERLHAGGFSLGGHAAMMYLEAVGDRAASASMVDPAGLCNVLRPIGAARFFAYSAVEMAATAMKLKPKVDGLFEEELNITAAYEKLMESSGLPASPELSKEEILAEFKEVTWPTKGKALKSLEQVLHKAAADEKEFELRAYVSPMRFITDNRSVAQTNAMLSKFDTANPEQTTVSYGFLQQQAKHWWHDLSVDPQIIRTLVRTPMDQLRKRLRYFK